MPQHLSDWEAAAYVDGRLSAAARARAESHIENCPACRAEIIDVAHVLDSSARPAVRRPRRRLLVSGLGIAAAAALAVVLLRPPASIDRNRQQQREISGGVETEGVPTIAVVRPASGDTVAGTDRRFVWHAVGGDATYQLTLGDDAGRILWRTTTGDTTLTLPADVTRVGETYFWHVDALLPTGVTATTRAHSFIVRRP